MANQSQTDFTKEIFTVLTFNEENPELTVRLPRPSDQRLIVRQVKNKVGEILELKRASLRIFGLFLGALGDPRELLLDADFVPENNYRLCFQRLSFDEEDEVMLTREDDSAMKLIFCEIKDMHHRGKILPRPKQETLSSLEALLPQAEGDQLPSKPNLSCMKSFVGIIRSIPLFYWSLFYRVDNCILQCSISTPVSQVGEGTEIHVVLNIERLLFLDVSGKEIASWFWDEVHLLRVHTVSAQQLVMFEVLSENEHGESCKDILKSIYVETDCNVYLYSVAVHILNVLEEKFTRKHFQPPEDHVHEVVNKSFRKKMIPSKPRSDSYYRS